jgi:hypothetical protein
MPIFAKNIIVGGNQPPTTETKVIEPVKTISFQTLKKEAVVKQKIVEELVEPEPSRYITKEDGELIRQINTKSNYLKDMVEI